METAGERINLLRRALVQIRDDDTLRIADLVEIAKLALRRDTEAHMMPKQGKDYMEFLEKTAAEVDTWPDWKKGK